MTPDDLREIRRELKPIADRLRSLTKTEFLFQEEHMEEALANAMLAFRHLEDASMRLGKTIQAIDGGTSVYDKAEVPGA